MIHRVLLVVAITLALSGRMEAAPFSLMIGDNDGFGLGVADNATVIWPGPGLSGSNYDGRSLAEATAVNGAQFTDSYAAASPGFGPHATQIATFIFPLGATMQSGSLVVDMGDFQANVFGQYAVSFNGVAQPNLFNFSDGFQRSAVRAFVLSPASVANANAAGQFVVTVNSSGSSDFVAFDFLQLNGELTEVPEPASLVLWGVGCMGLAWSARRKRKAPLQH